MPFDLFRPALLAHSPNKRCSLFNTDKYTAVHALVDLDVWANHIPHKGMFSAGYTWPIATTALFWHILSRQINSMLEVVPGAPKADVQKVITSLDAGGFFVRHPLWPPAVLHRVSELPSDREVVKDLISDALRNVRGSAGLLLRKQWIYT